MWKPHMKCVQISNGPSALSARQYSAYRSWIAPKVRATAGVAANHQSSTA